MSRVTRFLCVHMAVVRPTGVGVKKLLNDVVNNTTSVVSLLAGDECLSLSESVHADFGAPIECALPHWPAGDCEAAVTAVQQWGRTAAALLVERGAATCARAVSGRKAARRRGRRRGARQ